MPTSLRGLQAEIAGALARVQRVFDEQLASDLPPVSRLCGHVERYRGKMLRPTLVLACGMAAAGEAGEPAAEAKGGEGRRGAIGHEHIVCGAVCEMIHMATLVHDDVLDESDTRRRAPTINGMNGNETAVILGDYLIAGAYHLCSQLDTQAVALEVGRVSMTLCAGELLQLSRRGDLSLDEPTYFEIVDRKTAALIALSCGLGARCSGAGAGVVARFEQFGRELGVAFQIQDDLLDLTGRSSELGKPTGKDLEKGKLTLPIIHHLATAVPLERGRTLRLLESPVREREQLAAALERSGSVEHARRVALERVERGKRAIEAVPESAAKSLLMLMADAVVDRTM